MSFCAALRPLALFAALAAALPAGAEDYETGNRAWQAGRPGDAIEAWREAAAGGDARAMLALGRRYRDGIGLPQDWVLAHMWLNLAASRGAEDAVAERNALTRDLTPEERAEAQRRARNWRPDSDRRAAAEEELRGTASTAPPQPTAASGGPAPASASAKRPPISEPPPHAIRDAQRLLVALGYEPGPADGIWGARTGGAYRAFLRDAGLSDEETLSPPTLKAMHIAAGNRGVLPPSRPGSAAPGPAKRPQRPAGLDRLQILDRVGGLRNLLGDDAKIPGFGR